MVSRQIGVGCVRDVGEGLASRGAGYGDKDLVSGGSQVRIGELGGELAEWRFEIGGC